MVINRLTKSVFVLSLLALVPGLMAVGELDYAKNHKKDLALGSVVVGGTLAGAGYFGLPLLKENSGAMIKAGVKNLSSMVYKHSFISTGIVGVSYLAMKYGRAFLPSQLQITGLKVLKGINWVGAKTSRLISLACGKIWSPIQAKIDEFKKSKKD